MKQIFLEEHSLETVGSIEICDDLGLAGHPGLVAEMYRLPLAKGRYRISADGRTRPRCTKIRIELETTTDLRATVPIKQNICSECAGGIMLGDYGKLDIVRDYFDKNSQDLNLDPWNDVADGLCCTKIEELHISRIDFRWTFAFVASDEYYHAFALEAQGVTCGYELACNRRFGEMTQFVQYSSEFLQ